MDFVYHSVPEKMVGSLLVPLNQMQASMPELYKNYLEKYAGRKEILERRIPLLDCLWNDVVQFLPLHPQEVFKLQVKFGLIPKIPPYKFFEVDISSLDPKNTVVYFKTAPGEENITVKWLRDVEFAELQTIPETTINYYKSLIDTGELPFNYQFIPHVLYKGPISTKDLRIITLN